MLVSVCGGIGLLSQSRACTQGFRSNEQGCGAEGLGFRSWGLGQRVRRCVGYNKSCMTLSTFYPGNYGTTIYSCHAGLLVSTVTKQGLGFKGINSTYSYC